MIGVAADKQKQQGSQHKQQHSRGRVHAVRAAVEVKGDERSYRERIKANKGAAPDAGVGRGRRERRRTRNVCNDEHADGHGRDPGAEARNHKGP